MRRPCCFVLGIAALLLIAAAPRSGAHSQLVGTLPAPNQDLARSPDEIVLRFDQTVRPQSVRVLGTDGEDVTAGRPANRAGDETRVVLPLPELKRGAYVVAWRVVSGDGHPIRGAFTFRVGDTGDVSAASRLAESVLGARGSALVAGLTVIGRALTLLALVVTVGMLAVLVLHGPGSPGRRTRAVASGAAIAAVASAALLAVALAAWIAGRGPSALGDRGLLTELAESRDGRLLSTRAAAVVVAALAGAFAASTRVGKSRAIALGVGGVAAAGAVVALSAAGHASTGRSPALGIAANVVHVLAGSAWLGGVIVLLLVGAPSRRLLLRFSRTASVCVAAVVASGLVHAWRQVGGREALTTTDYGRLLMVKVALVACVVALGAHNRTAIRRSLDGARTRLGAETLTAICVVALTAMLSQAVPARDAVDAPVSRTIATDGLTIDVTLEPARVGRNELHVYVLTPQGQIADAQSATVELDLADAGVERLRAPVLRVGRGHWSTGALDLPLPGTWEVRVSVKVDDFTQYSGSTVMDVR